MYRRHTFLGLLAIAGALAIASVSAVAKTPDVPVKVRQAMQDRNFAAAIAAIDESAKDKDAPQDYLAYLKGRALHLAEKYDDAIARFDTFEKEFPKSPWARRSRFAMAASLARKGDFRAAELIYRKEADYLLSADRKQEIADLYLEFAQAYFKPPKEEQKPDYQKALDFFQRALAVGPKPERRAEVELLVAQCYQNLNNFAQAATLYTKFAKDHPDSPLLVEAKFRLGECQLKQNQLAEARRTWQDLLAAHSTSKSERIAETTYNISLTYQIPAPPSDEDLGLGVAALETFAKKYPDHKLASQAYLRIAQSYIHRARYDDAARRLTTFLADKAYADREEIPDARNLLGQSYLLQNKFTEALGVWRDYLAKHPTHRAWRDVQAAIVNAQFAMAQQQRTLKKYDEARKLWSEFLVNYPLDGRSPAILFAFGQMNFDQKKWDEAIADWQRLASKYPGTQESSQAQFAVGVVLEDKLGRLDEALKQYRKVEGPFAGHAAQRIAQLTAKTMTVATVRVFRTDETPKLKFTSRNIDAVTVRVYTIDLETYFRKMHLAGGVESLDISLIDPDASFEFKVPTYKEYQRTENEIEVPLPKNAEGQSPVGGAMAVTVTGKTLTATTLVLQSDLDLVVKSSRNEVFVFAENMRTGKPWPKARLLVSNGKQVFAEAVTGDDGVFQKDYKELESAEDVRVFGIADRSIASNIVNLSGVGVAQGLADKGYIYTDRPAYRPGDLVHLRGVLRGVSGDGYTIDAGGKYTVQVFDTRSRLLYQESVTLSAMGSFHSHFILPPASVQGDYRILVVEASPKVQNPRTYQGSFGVHEYRLEPVRLVIDTGRKVYYRGEEIEGKITAQFYYGAPLAGREIRYQLAGGRVFTATTDDKGEVKIKLPTREFRESQVLPLVVMLPERNIGTTANFFLSTQGFSIAVSTIRPVYLSGESFEVSVKTLDAEGKPSAQKLTLKVLQQTNVDGRVGERLVKEYPLATDEKDATARQTMALADGGRYILRVEGTDRFNNPITGASIVQLSDDGDTVRLRLLADKHTFKVGDAAAVNLHWREKPALALVTFQGARVLQYKLVDLKTGDNKLDLPMSANLAPNFELSVAVMTDVRSAKDAAAAKDAAPAKDAKGTKLVGIEADKPKPAIRLHTASSPFTVMRDLNVKLEIKRKPDAKGSAKPGEEVEVVVTATDPQGRPVEAELSLGMIEQSLLDRFDWQVPAIGDFFRGAHRATAVRTTSSITFAYYPATQAINPRLLAEADRKEVEKDEALKLADVRKELERAPIRDMAAIHAGNAGENFADDAPAGNESGRRGRRSGITAGLQSVDMTPSDFLQMGLALEESEDKSEADGEQLMAFGVLADKQQSRSQMTGRYGGSRSKSMELKNGSMFRGAGGRGAQAGADGQVATEAFAPSEIALAQDPGGGVRFATPYAKQPARADHFYHDLYTNADPANLGKLVEGRRREVLSLSRDGKMSNLQLGEWGVERTVAEGKKLADAGVVLLPDLGPQETGYWNPALVTDKNGKATVTFALPDRSTAWKLVAKGITAHTLAGEATSEITVKKDLFGELKLPLALTDGDAAEILVSIHNHALDKGAIKIALKTTIGGKSSTEVKTIDVKKQGIDELVFKQAIARPDGTNPAGKDAISGAASSIEIELTVDAEGHRDVVRRVLPIQPYGMSVYALASGAGTSDTTAWVEAPAGVADAARSMQIIVGPSVERSLLDVLLGAAPMCQIDAARIASGLDAATSDLMAAVALQRLVKESRDAAGPQSQALDARVRSSLGLLVAAQNDDGGWSWTGRGGASNRYTSARVVWALSLARGAGYAVPQDGFDRALNFLSTQVAATSDADYESKSILLHALATAGRGDFALANRLYRNRPALSTGALLHLTLALAEMDRKPMAEDLMKLLDTRKFDEPTTRRLAESGTLPWSHGGAELRALYAIALQEVAPTSAKTKELVDWLLANRTGHRWSPEKATGPAMIALGKWFSKNRFAGEHYTLDVYVNDRRVKVLEIDENSGTQTLDVPAAFLGKGRQRVNLLVKGRGRFTYQCILGGFVPADKLVGTTKDWEVKRYYEPATLELDGQPIPRGFGVLSGAYTTFRNPLTQLPVGKRAHVQLDITRNNVPANTPDDHLEYLVVTEPIPSGTTVIENTVAGGFERFEVSAGAITFYVGSRRYVPSIRYELNGYLAGQYRAAPTVIRNAYRPDQIAVAAPVPLAVLALGGQSVDPYRLTPQELYELGRRYYDKRDYEAAGKHLTELLAKWNLAPDYYKQSARMLLDVHLEKGPAAQVVRYFEIIKEKWPDLEMPFEKIVKVGAAYHDMGEYERSYLIFRATVESSFSRENGVAGFLDSQGEFVRSVDVMERILAEYPPEPYIAAASYALAQQVYAKAPEAAADVKLREKKIARVDLVRQAHTMLENFLTANPEDPAADQAAFSAANAMLELKAYKDAIAACNQYARRYPKSDFLDSYWYLIGYCHFAQGEHAAALEMCRKVAEAKRIDRASQREMESVNKWRAIYIMGQIHHSLGKAAEAIAQYTQVKERFADAAQAIQYFDRKDIQLPEVTTLKPGETAEVKLSFRNVPQCDVKVYRIDLMKFSLLRSNLGGITNINLSGIRPHHEATVKLGDGKDYRDRDAKVPLPLKEEGAYLVVARGDDLHASGLVLVTPLSIEVQEDAESGRVRTTVKEGDKERYVGNVHVKVIGARNADFMSGATDLRGVFVADGIAGKSTVIAQVDARRYAFFRGKIDLGPPPTPQANAPAKPAEGKPESGKSQEKSLLEGIEGQNSILQQEQKSNLKRMYEQNKKGVQTKDAF